MSARPYCYVSRPGRITVCIFVNWNFVAFKPVRLCRDTALGAIVLPMFQDIQRDTFLTKHTVVSHKGIAARLLSVCAVPYITLWSQLISARGDDIALLGILLSCAKSQHL